MHIPYEYWEALLPTTQERRLNGVKTERQKAYVLHIHTSEETSHSRKKVRGEGDNIVEVILILMKMK